MAKKVKVAQQQEPHMSAGQLGYFRSLLESMLQDRMKERSELVAREVGDAGGDDGDRAEMDIEKANLAQHLDRVSCYINEIRAAIRRIDEGVFGYCEDTGDEIGRERLMVNPIARRTVEAEERCAARRRLYAV